MAAVVVAAVLCLHGGGDRGQKPSASRGLEPEDAQVPAGPRRGRDYALLIATEQYEHWGKLEHPKADARELAAVLRDRYGFETEVVEDPKHDDILLALRRCVRRYDDDDQVFVFIAGHGDFDAVTKEGFIVGRNSVFKDLTRGSYVPNSRLLDVIAKLPCRHVFLVMDVCFGGTIDFGTATPSMRGQDANAEISREELIRRKMRQRTRRFLTSGGLEAVPDHSVFARRLITLLQQDDPEGAGVIDIPQMFRAVEKLKPEPREGAFQGNEPGSNFLFIRPR